MFVRRRTSGSTTCLIVGAIAAVTLLLACIVAGLAVYIASDSDSVSEEQSSTVTSTPTIAQQPEDAIVSVLDVDQGQAVLIVAPDGSAALIDSGRSQTRIREEIEPYARSLGVKDLDYLILSHPDQDHVGGMPQVLDSFAVGAWIDPAIPSTNQTYEETLEVILDRDIPAILARQGVELQLGESVRLNLLWPGPEFIEESGEPDSNENSAVVMISVGSVDVLVTGDLEDQGEQALINQMGANLNSEILVVGHHGSSSSSTPEFLDTVDPEVAVISAGEDNQYGHPHDEVLQRLRFRSIDIYRTDQEGTIEIHLNDEGYSIETIETDTGS